MLERELTREGGKAKKIKGLSIKLQLKLSLLETERGKQMFFMFCPYLCRTGFGKLCYILCHKATFVVYNILTLVTYNFKAFIKG